MKQVNSYIKCSRKLTDQLGGTSCVIFSLSWYPHELGKANKICLRETYCTVRVARHLSDLFPIKRGLKQGDVLSPLLFNFALEYGIRRAQANQGGFKLMTYVSFKFMLLLIQWAETYILKS